MRTLRLTLVSATIGFGAGACLVMHLLSDPLVDKILGRR